MDAAYDIRYLKRQDIDTRRWDDCIDNAANGLIYASHFYLDHMAAHQWDALVLNDYQAVMPLPWRRKAGIRYLYQPAFTQQSGIFTSLQPGHSPTNESPPSPLVNALLLNAFLQKLPSHFPFAEIYLNYGNEHPNSQGRTNFILPLDASYEQLAANYRKDLIRNLKRTVASPMQYQPDFDLRTALEVYRREYAARIPHLRPLDYLNFERLCLLMQDLGQLLVRGVTGPQQQLLAAAVLFRDRNRLYLLQSTTLPAGRNTEANHFLLDQIIREWAGSRLILDFEGSDLPGIAHFYANFGGRDQPYFFYRYNQLPWPLRLLKA